MPSTGAGNDYQKDLQFRKLNAQKEIIEVTVTRGRETLVGGHWQASAAAGAWLRSSAPAHSLDWQPGWHQAQATRLFVQIVKNTDLVVGDVYLINMGDKVVADGIMIDGFHLVIDEASLTGMSVQL